MNPESIRKSLQAVHPPPSDPTALRISLADALLQARSLPELEADWRMAEAALQHPDALMLWEESLRYLGANRLQEQRYVHEQIAHMRFTGGDPIRARQHLQSALDCAKQTHDGLAHMRLACRLGCSLMVAGLPQQARPLLETALHTATEHSDTLTALGCSTMLAGLCLDVDALDEAAVHGRRTMQLGAQRGNWIAVADGCITQSICLMHQQRHGEALRCVLDGVEQLQHVHATAALNLLRAQLVLLRTTIGEDEFDAQLSQLRPTTRAIAAEE